MFTVQVSIQRVSTGKLQTHVTDFGNTVATNLLFFLLLKNPIYHKIKHLITSVNEITKSI